MGSSRAAAVALGLLCGRRERSTNPQPVRNRRIHLYVVSRLTAKRRQSSETLSCCFGGCPMAVSALVLGLGLAIVLDASQQSRSNASPSPSPSTSTRNAAFAVGHPLRYSSMNARCCIGDRAFQGKATSSPLTVTHVSEQSCHPVTSFAGSVTHVSRSDVFLRFQTLARHKN